MKTVNAQTISETIAHLCIAALLHSSGELNSMNA